VKTAELKVGFLFLFSISLMTLKGMNTNFRIVTISKSKRISSDQIKQLNGNFNNNQSRDREESSVTSLYIVSKSKDLYSVRKISYSNLSLFLGIML
jgi:hypothetical protein